MSSRWIKWQGGERAPADWDGGKVKFRDGSIDFTSGDHSRADSICWQDDGMPEDIVGYHRAKSS